jgi:hypothetical protein
LRASLNPVSPKIIPVWLMGHVRAIEDTGLLAHRECGVSANAAERSYDDAVRAPPPS